MTKLASDTKTFIVPITAFPIEQTENNEVFQALLNGREFVTIGHQILFEQEGQYYLSRIDNEHYNYNKEDYSQLPESAPYQLIDGKLEFMPSPLDQHQKVLGKLYVSVVLFVEQHNLGEVRFAPLDVHFDEENVFQPDLLFVSNARKDIIQKYIHGAPDLIVEVLSSNKKYDLGKKKETYGTYNVLEYWAIDYQKQTLDAYENRNAEMILRQTYEGEDEVKSIVLKDFSFPLSKIFQ